MAKTREVSIRNMREMLRYDPAEGHFYWKSDGASAEISDPHGYRIITGFGRHTMRAHRLAWLVCYGEMPAGEIDHINGKKDDNRIANLRIASRSENMQNQFKAKAGAPTPYLGVGRARNGKYRAQITINKKQKYLGAFKTPEEAHRAYLTAKAEYHKDWNQACNQLNHGGLSQ